MAVRLCRAWPFRRPKPLQEPRIRVLHRAAAIGTFRHCPLPTAYPGQEVFRALAQTRAATMGAAHALNRASVTAHASAEHEPMAAAREITAPKLDPAARIIFVPLATLRRVA